MFFFLFSSNKQKIIAYTNEKLIFQAFHYHSQGNGKKVSNSVRECWYYCYFLNNSVRFTFNVGLNIENVQKQMFLFWQDIPLLRHERFFLKQRLKNHYCPWVNAYGFYL